MEGDTRPDPPPPPVDLPWVGQVRGAAALSLLLLAFSLAVLIRAMGRPCHPWGSLARNFHLGHHLAMLFMGLWPYLWILALSWGGRTSKGLAAAWAWGRIMVAVSVVLFGIALQGVFTGRTGAWLLGALGLFGLTQVVLVVGARRALAGWAPAARELTLRRWGFRPAGVYFVLSLLVVGGQPISRTREAAGHSRALGELRELVEAQASHARAHPEKGFAPRLKDLGLDPEAFSVREEDLARGHLRGYAFTLVPGPPNPRGQVTAYQIGARPHGYGGAGCMSFFADETGVIRSTWEDRAATARDSPP